MGYAQIIDPKIAETLWGHFLSGSGKNVEIKAGGAARGEGERQTLEKLQPGYHDYCPGGRGEELPCSAH